MHEQSETVQNDAGKWINVYGANTAKAGKPLPKHFGFEKDEYDTVTEAEDAARRRSQAFGKGYSSPLDADPMTPEK